MASFDEALKNCLEAHDRRREWEAKLKEERYSLSDLDNAMDVLVAGRPTATGVSVTANTALTCVPYFAGVRLIAETVGQLPLIEYRRLSPRGKERAADRKVYQLLHDAPNPEMDAISFKESLQGQAVTWGNAFAEIQWDTENGMPVALWPLRADKMKVGRDTVNGQIIYVYALPDGTTAKLPAWRIWHMPGFGFDGLIGYDTVYQAREAIGMAMALEEFGARFFGNGSSPSGVLTHPNRLTTSAQDTLRKQWQEMHSGLSNQHRVAILEEGMKYQQIGIPPDNAQFLETRKFQIIEIARLLNIPPHMLRDLERATFSNIEHQAIEFVTYTMTPWFVRWEQTCKRKLLLPGEQNTYFVEFLVDALLRGDSASRAAFYKELYYMGVLSPNDIREKENMNPIGDPAGDKYYVQANMIPLDMAGQQVTKQIASAQLNGLLQDAVKRVAEREKQNLLRQAKKQPENFHDWLAEFYRDFVPFIDAQVGPVFKAVGQDNGERLDFIRRYVQESRRRIELIDPKTIETSLDGWEQKRATEANLIAT